ncbi:hypothetical protein SEA_SHAM_223 [Streptomyces phage Sham]|nr:hypothetical protein SEA_SHAM_223 [Streptomyces phage Sham]
MDDFFEFLVICILLPFLFIMLVIGLVRLADEEDKEDQKKNDKRYELCLNRNMQWVDGNCISK